MDSNLGMWVTLTRSLDGWLPTAHTMNLTNLFTDNRAVSPVIGVILMVAITVILAAVIGTFVLGIGQETGDSPRVSLTFDHDADAIYHNGGDGLVGEDLSYVGGTSLVGATGDLGAGDNLLASGSYTDTDAVSVVWNDPASDTSAIIAKYN